MPNKDFICNIKGHLNCFDDPPADADDCILDPKCYEQGVNYNHCRICGKVIHED